MAALTFDQVYSMANQTVAPIQAATKTMVDNLPKNPNIPAAKQEAVKKNLEKIKDFDDTARGIAQQYTQANRAQQTQQQTQSAGMGMGGGRREVEE